MTPEGKVKQKVRRLLDKYGVHSFMPVQSGLGARHVDIIGCVAGYYFCVEVKAEGKDATDAQKVTMRDVRRAGGVTFVISSVDDPRLAHLEYYLAWCSKRPAARPVMLKQYTTEPTEKLTA